VDETVCTCIIRLSHATANFMQLVLSNWANFQLHVSHATENQLHKIVAKCQISSSAWTNLTTWVEGNSACGNGDYER